MFCMFWKGLCFFFLYLYLIFNRFWQALGTVVEAFWGVLGKFLECLGVSWGGLGRVLGGLGKVLGPQTPQSPASAILEAKLGQVGNQNPREADSKNRSFFDGLLDRFEVNIGAKLTPT